jgi:hypothetical protein
MRLHNRVTVAAQAFRVVHFAPCLSFFQSGTKMAEKRKQVIKITTGSAALDKLLGGGIESMRSARTE